MTDEENDLIIKKTLYCEPWPAGIPPLPRPVVVYRHQQQAEIPEPSKLILLALLGPFGLLAGLLYLILGS